MKIKFSNNFKWLCVISVAAYLVYAVPEWYWTMYSFVHPDVTRQYEVKFADYSDEKIERIMNERTSPRTDAASLVWEKRHPVNKPFMPWTNTTVVR